MRWQAVPPDALTLRELDGELAVRNALTGSTHLLEAPAAGVLAALIDAETGLTVPELTARTRDALAPADMEELLAEFQRLGLAEPAG